MGDSLWSVQRIRAAINEVEGAAPPAQTPDAKDWKLKDEEASEHYGKDIYVYYGAADFAPGVDPCKIFDGLIPLYTASPAQTPPPRLTDKEVYDVIAENWNFANIAPRSVKSFALGIETAVRKQFGVTDD